jgi:hypothetical protein
MKYFFILVALLSGCVTIVKHQCVEDLFLDDEVRFKQNEKVNVLFDEKFSFYENSCLKNGKVLEIVGWEKGTLYYQVEIVCKSNDGKTYIRRSIKIPQHLLEKA